MLFVPLLLITSIAIKLESSGSIFGQRPIHVGQMLTQSGIDELPQLINVLRGEMSIFGRRNVYRWPGPHLNAFIGRLAVNFAKLPELLRRKG